MFQIDLHYVGFYRNWQIPVGTLLYMSSSVTCWVSVHDISDRTGDSNAGVICWHRTVASGGVQTILEHDTIGFGHHGVEVIGDRMSVVACLWRPITGHAYAHDGTSVRLEVM